MLHPSWSLSQEQNTGRCWLSFPVYPQLLLFSSVSSFVSPLSRDHAYVIRFLQFQQQQHVPNGVLSISTALSVFYPNVDVLFWVQRFSVLSLDQSSVDSVEHGSLVYEALLCRLSHIVISNGNNVFVRLSSVCMLLKHSAVGQLIWRVVSSVEKWFLDSISQSLPPPFRWNGLED